MSINLGIDGSAEGFRLGQMSHLCQYFLEHRGECYERVDGASVGGFVLPAKVVAVQGCAGPAPLGSTTLCRRALQLFCLLWRDKAGVVVAFLLTEEL